MVDLAALREALDMKSPKPVALDIVVAAARELLTGEKVWVCEAHKAGSWSRFLNERHICPVQVALDGKAASDCRMVEALLIVAKGRET